MKHGKEKVKVPVLAQQAKAEMASKFPMNEPGQNQEQPIPWYIERLSGIACLHFFLEKKDEMLSVEAVDKIIQEWLDKRETFRALQMFELSWNDVDRIKIPGLTDYLVGRIISAYIANMANKNHN